MWENEENYLTPAYLLGARIGLGSIIALLSTGALINAIIIGKVDLPPSPVSPC